MTGITNYQWILQKRPEGRVKRSDFEFRQSELPPLQAGECLVKVLYMAMDPATRGWMSASGGYLEPLPLGGPVMGVTIGKVVESRNPQIEAGTVVAGVGQWAKYMIVGPQQISPVRTGSLGILAPMDVSTGFELPMYLHAMGTSGGTAHRGLFDIAAMKAGDKVLVSGAAGSVGSLVAQMARLKGAAKVVGIAGGAEKCATVVRDYGCDACIDYRATDNLSAAIAREFPDGLDVFFDNVGGDILEAAIDNLAKGARIAVSGMVSQYNNSEPAPGPRNLWNLVVNTARIEGFLVGDYFGTPASEAAYREIAAWLKAGQLNARLDVREDFENTPDVFNQLFTGGNNGRLVMKVPD
ncbi:NADP-dependent oxidoreductase [Aromatoleum diolicum]|uniref:Zinc-binding dehydrogenase n=1 Tax=Aromatoleum diolicum TaxID=75796 RepID=A0ABX1Q8C3_9RHOO|nr:NADP-dependent oxidoreductase [Aromatoleum diolicum]NMG73652.1 zinc-binding dehydrogenase [Aromatoleum diolicum]